MHDDTRPSPATASADTVRDFSAGAEIISLSTYGRRNATLVEEAPQPEKPFWMAEMDEFRAAAALQRMMDAVDHAPAHGDHGDAFAGPLPDDGLDLPGLGFPWLHDEDRSSPGPGAAARLLPPARPAFCRTTSR